MRFFKLQWEIFAENYKAGHGKQTERMLCPFLKYLIFNKRLRIAADLSGLTDNCLRVLR